MRPLEPIFDSRLTGREQETAIVQVEGLREGGKEEEGAAKALPPGHSPSRCPPRSALTAGEASPPPRPARLAKTASTSLSRSL